jgi:hypothetical protein
MKMVLKMFLQQVTDGHMNIQDLNWTMIDNYVAENLHLQRGYVGQLRKNWFEDGDIMISGCSGTLKVRPKRTSYMMTRPMEMKKKSDQRNKNVHMLNSNQ